MAADRPLLLIVTGPPASGKTTIATQLAHRLGLPALYKDEIKETLGDVVPGAGLEWSQTLGRAAYRLMFQIGMTLIDAGVSCLLEANFHPEMSLPGFTPLAARANVVQVVCTADPALLTRRYLERHGAGVRHPVHLDADPARRDQLVAAFRRDHRLDLDGLVLRCDTSADTRLDVDPLAVQIREWLESRGVSDSGGIEPAPAVLDDEEQADRDENQE